MRKVFDTNAASRHVGVSPTTLEKLRVCGGGPAFIKIGRRVLYTEEAITEFIDSRRVLRTTSDAVEENPARKVGPLSTSEDR